MKQNATRKILQAVREAGERFTAIDIEAIIDDPELPLRKVSTLMRQLGRKKVLTRISWRKYYTENGRGRTGHPLREYSYRQRRSA